MMPQEFRKKPVVVKAMQWDGTIASAHAIRHFWPYVQLDIYTGGVVPTATVSVPTLEGMMKAEAGGWIVQGVKGELYPVKAEIFEATYRPADEPDEALEKAKLWMKRKDIAPHIHPAMAGLLEKYLGAPIEECRDWNARVNAPQARDS